MMEGICRGDRTDCVHHSDGMHGGTRRSCEGNLSSACAIGDGRANNAPTLNTLASKRVRRKCCESCSRSRHWQFLADQRRSATSSWAESGVSENACERDLLYRHSCGSWNSHREASKVLPRVPLCPLCLRISPDAKAETESPRGWYANQSAACTAGPRPPPRHPPAASHTTAPGCSLHPSDAPPGRRAPAPPA